MTVEQRAPAVPTPQVRWIDDLQPDLSSASLSASGSVSSLVAIKEMYLHCALAAAQCIVSGPVCGWVDVCVCLRRAEPQIFTQPQPAFPGARDGQNLISWWRSLPSPTNPVWWRSMHAISSYRGNRPTNKHTNPQTNRQDRLQYTALLSLARSVILITHL